MRFYAIRFFLAAFLATATAFASPAKNSVCSDLFTGLRLATSPYLSESRQNPVARRLLHLYDERSDQDHLRFDQRLANRHAQLEMSFQVKNPATGMYDKFVAVPVVSRVAVLGENQYNDLIQSTGPVLRALRRLLQNLYSAPLLNSHHLGLDGLPEHVQKQILSVISESIYFEPRLRSPRMREYPFLAVAGFDGALGDPENPVPKFFEMNLGTPSGLSNNAVLLQNLMGMDAQAAAILRPHLVPDRTFIRLRQTIEDNALKWTGIPGGLSVIISPGIYNGAHADVAEISRQTGMPLVKAGDLYMDEGGFIRLNTGAFQNHPIVTGIYGRSEESFFLQDNHEGTPLISPNFVEINTALSARLGLALRVGAIYRYIRNSQGEIVDVERDARGNPVFESVWDQMGADPRTGKRRGSFLSAVLSGRLYYSAIGGRIVDDKRLFHVVSKYLAAVENAPQVAAPVSSLERHEYHLLYAHPEKYVVKEPANSGGQGVYFLSQENAEDRARILNRVRAHPEDFEVQELRAPNTLVHYEAGRRGEVRKTEVATDMRFFVFMDSDGNVSSGANGGLLRTAPPGLLYSNTSRGGGYGVFAVVRDQADQNAQLGAGNLERTNNTNIGQAAYAKTKLDQVSITMGKGLDILRLILHLENQDRALTSADVTPILQELRDLSFQMRDLLEFLPPALRSMVSDFRDVADADATTVQLSLAKQKVLRMFSRFETEKSSFDTPLKERVKQFFADHLYELQTDHGYNESSAYAFLRERLTLRYLPEPEVIFVYDDVSGHNEKIEVAEVTDLQDTTMRRMLREVKAAGGEIRMARVRTTRLDGAVAHSSTPAYFWVNYSKPELSSYLRPILVFDPFQPRALSALVHEFEHFKHWREMYQELRSHGVSEGEAIRQAYEKTDDDTQLLIGERRAVGAEIAAEVDATLQLNPFNRPRLRERPRLDEDFGITNRRLYPEFEVLRRVVLRLQTNHAQTGDEQTATKLMDTMIQHADASKKKALAMTALPADIHARWQNAPLVDLIAYPFGIERLRSMGIADAFMNLYRERLAALGLPDDSAHSRIHNHLDMDEEL